MEFAYELPYGTTKEQVGESTADDGILCVVFAPLEIGDRSSEGLQKGDRKRIRVHKRRGCHRKVSGKTK